MVLWRRTRVAGAAVSFAAMASLSATHASAQQVPAGTTVLPTVDVVATTPLSGSGVDVEKVPASVTTLDSRQISAQHSPNVVDTLAVAVPSVDVSVVSGNPFQPDVTFRGFDASPVAGTPQGLAIYQNGMRINEAFGDIVNWDFLPTVAIRSMDLVGSNPAFGLNALGGAISLQMKDGFSYQGLSVDTMAGSFGRIQSSLQYGKLVDNWAAYLAVEAMRDNGYRYFSPSEIWRAYGDIGYRGDKAEFHINLGTASNSFGASAAAPWELLQDNWAAVYTTPQTNQNQVGYVNATANVNISPTWTLQGNAYVRSYFQRTQDGNSTNVQPCADPTLLCYGDSVTPANGVNGQPLSNPFPSDATLGENDRTETQTTSEGVALQGANTDKLFGHDNHFVLGASLDYGVTRFGASAELGTIQPDYSVTSSGIFLGASGDPVSDGPVSLLATNLYEGAYAVDTFDVNERLSITAGARLNIANIHLADQIGTALDGQDQFWSLNPQLGATFKLGGGVSLYGGYSQTNRAPTPLELGCADPAHPCVLATFLVADPPLKQVVAETFEAGLRGRHEIGPDNGALSWKLGLFRTISNNDILEIADPIQQGFGYFQNVGNTQRQGLEAQATYKTDKFSVTGSYAYLDATFLNGLTLASNSPAADANGLIYVQPGDKIPMIPAQTFKLSGDYDITSALNVEAELIAIGPQYFAGDASNQNPELPGYAVVNATVSYRATPNLLLYVKAENLLDHRYYTYGTYFDTGDVPNFAAGGAPLVDPRTLTPASPQAIYAGVRATF